VSQRLRKSSDHQLCEALPASYCRVARFGAPVSATLI